MGGTTINYIQNPSGNIWLISAGVILAVLANISSSVSNYFLAESKGKPPLNPQDRGEQESDQEALESAPINPKKDANNPETLSLRYSSIQTGESASDSKLGEEDHRDADEEDGLDSVLHKSRSKEDQSVADRMKIGFLVQCSAFLADRVIAHEKRRRMIGVLLSMGAGLAFSVWPSVLNKGRQIQEDNESDGFTGIYVTNYVCFFLMMVFGLLTVVLFSFLSFIGFPSLTCSHANWRAYLDVRIAPWHGLAVGGGAVWALGTWANLLASETIGFTISYFLGQASVLITALLGIFVWKEYNGSPRSSRLFLLIFFLLYILAVVCISLAAIF